MERREEREERGAQSDRVRTEARGGRGREMHVAFSNESLSLPPPSHVSLSTVSLPLPPPSHVSLSTTS
jgi:hypothetical protein